MVLRPKRVFWLDSRFAIVEGQDKQKHEARSMKKHKRESEARSTYDVKRKVKHGGCNQMLDLHLRSRKYIFKLF